MANAESRELAKLIIAEMKKDLPQVIGGVQLPREGVVAASCVCDGKCGCNENCGCQGKEGCGCNSRCPCDTKEAVGVWNWAVNPPPDFLIDALMQFRTFSAEQQTKVMDAVSILAEKQRRYSSD